MKRKRLTRLFAFLLLLSTGLSASAQSNLYWRDEADKLIENIDSLARKSQQTFYQRNVIRVDRSFKNDVEVRETWHYTLNKGKLVYCEIRYLVDSLEYIESYYVNNDRLVCVENYATEFFNPSSANFVSGEVLFYVNEEVKLRISIGQHKDPLTAWRLQRRPYEKFLDRYSSLKRSMKDISLLNR